MSKGQVQGVGKGDSLRQVAFIAELFGVSIYIPQKDSDAPFCVFLFVFLQHSASSSSLALDTVTFPT